MRRHILLTLVISTIAGCTDATRPISSDPRAPEPGKGRFTLRLTVPNPSEAPMYLSRCSVTLQRRDGHEWVVAWRPTCSFWHWPSEMGGMIEIRPGSEQQVSIEFTADRNELTYPSDDARGSYRAFVATFPEIPVVRLITSPKQMIHAKTFWISEVTLIRR